jgi:hypothetical protein
MGGQIIRPVQSVGTTRIRFALASDEVIEFTVLDVLGRSIAHESLGSFACGENSFAWQAANHTGLALGPGLYFYYLRGRHESEMRKLVLLK